MKLIVGLGNPGEKYEQTRHNLGFMAVDRFMKDFEAVERSEWTENGKFKSWIVDLNWQPKEGEMERVILAKPQTYMNNSGMAVGLIASFYKIVPEDVWVVHDELDLPLGAMRIRFGGAAAGHHGVESVIEGLGTDKFWRFRLGIGSDHFAGGVEDYVLSPFGEVGYGKARELIKHTADAISFALEKGLEKAMNKCNTK
jgi:PTH1 family peptidyl-tRNA hydrolase